MENYVFLSESDLRAVIREELATLATPTKEEKDAYSIEEAVSYLGDKGYRISKATLYGHTSKGTIDFSRFGERKLSFSADQLDAFVRKMRH